MIEIFKRPRQGGKTHHVVSWYLTNPQGRVVVTYCETEAVRIRKKIVKRMRGLWGPDKVTPALERHVDASVISVHSLPHRLRGVDSKAVYIDNADLVLSSLVGMNTLEGVTWNGDPNN